MESKFPVRRISRVTLLFLVMIGIVGATGVVFTLRRMAAFAWTTHTLEPWQVDSGRIRGGDGPSTYRFTIRPRGGKVRFYFGPIVWGNPASGEDLKRAADSSEVLEDGGDYRLTKSVPGGASFWAIRNEGAETIVVDMKWDW
jgi:hypothetical protein